MKGADLAYQRLFDGGDLRKREYFALHADQPGVLEIITAAGHKCVMNHWVDFGDGTPRQTFNDWYEALSQRERFALQAKVRVQMADALLHELAKGYD